MTWVISSFKLGWDIASAVDVVDDDDDKASAWEDVDDCSPSTGTVKSYKSREFIVARRACRAGADKSNGPAAKAAAAAASGRPSFATPTTLEQ